jgi:hypothetical protein
VKKRHRIQFPSTDIRELSQDEVFFYLLDGEERTKIRLHEYECIYRIPGLYEQVVYERLKCQSPSTVAEVLQYSLSQSDSAGKRTTMSRPHSSRDSACQPNTSRS